MKGRKQARSSLSVLPWGTQGSGFLTPLQGEGGPHPAFEITTSSLLAFSDQRGRRGCGDLVSG